jgi:hypothetical protein
MCCAAHARHQYVSDSGIRALTAVLTSPLVIGCRTTSCIAPAAAVNAAIPSFAPSLIGPVAMRAVASASESGHSAAASAGRSARRCRCGAPRTDQTSASAGSAGRPPRADTASTADPYGVSWTPMSSTVSRVVGTSGRSSCWAATRYASTRTRSTAIVMGRVFQR